VLFHVTMTVKLPHDMDPEAAADLKAREKAIAAGHQRSGKWRHLWRVAGAYANVSIFDVADPAELHDLLTGLPLFPFMEISVTPLCRHPSSVRDGDL
jgi:muconolactone D-isomerase